MRRYMSTRSLALADWERFSHLLRRVLQVQVEKTPVGQWVRFQVDASTKGATYKCNVLDSNLGLADEIVSARMVESLCSLSLQTWTCLLCDRSALAEILTVLRMLHHWLSDQQNVSVVSCLMDWLCTAMCLNGFSFVSVCMKDLMSLRKHLWWQKSRKM